MAGRILEDENMTKEKNKPIDAEIEKVDVEKETKKEKQPVQFITFEQAIMKNLEILNAKMDAIYLIVKSKEEEEE